MTKMESEHIYRISNLRHGYGDRFMLNIPELKIKEGMSLGLSGPNGCGKSTLMKILAFLLDPMEGGIYFNGARCTKEQVSVRDKVTFLLQEPYLLKRTVFENVAYGLKQRRDTDNIKNRVDEAMRWVALPPEEFSQRKWFELSGGEAQRVALASRLILKPRALILDEPISSIDANSAGLIRDAILKMRENYNTTLIVSSHDQAWLNSVTDDVLRMYDGSLLGYETENIIPGPWLSDIDGLWSKKMNDRVKIFSAKPPAKNSTGILHPSDILISNSEPDGISAQNILQGTIMSMTAVNKSAKVKTDVEVDGVLFSCHVTEHAIHKLKLMPGKKIWILFKASSLKWN